MIQHRLPSNESAGVYIQFKTEKDLEKALLSVHWKRSESPLIGDGDEIFIAPIPGLMTIEKVENLRDNALISVESSKYSDKVTLVVRSICRSMAIQTYLITGMKEEKRVVLDFQPGEHVFDCEIALDKIGRKTYINKFTALKLGFKWVRLV